jgi:DNA-binding MarR family transcriptional regulator
MNRIDKVKKLSDQLMEIGRAVMARNVGSMPHMPQLPHKMPSPAQSRVLNIVAQHEGISVKEIAEALNITGSAATQLIDGLVEEGIVQRVEDPEDRRRFRVMISPQAKESIKTLIEFHYKTFLEITENLTEDELNSMLSIHEKILSSMHKHK